VVHEVDDWWHRKYTEDENGRLVKRDNYDEVVASAEAGGPLDPTGQKFDVHLPSPSYFPFIAAIGLPVIAYGMVYSAYVVAAIGGLIFLAAVYAWTFEPSVDPEPPEPVEAAAPDDAPELVGAPAAALEAGDAGTEES
jgi:cytochrome c oxidase subunit 1